MVIENWPFCAAQRQLPPWSRSIVPHVIPTAPCPRRLAVSVAARQATSGCLRSFVASEAVMKLMWRGAVAPTPGLDAQRMIHAGRVRDRITTNVSSKFPAQAGRYRFYAHGVQHRGQRPAPHRPFQARLECHNRTSRQHSTCRTGCAPEMSCRRSPTPAHRRCQGDAAPTGYRGDPHPVGASISLPRTCAAGGPEYRPAGVRFARRSARATAVNLV